MPVTLTPAAPPSGTLLWNYQKDGGQRTWVLQSGAASLASLTWGKRYGSNATAETAADTWHYERKGVFRHQFLIEDEAGTQVAEYVHRWTGGGILTLRNGRRFEWKPANFWGTRWQLVGADNTRLIEFRMKSWSLQPSAETTVTHAALKYDELPLLLTFCWFLCLLGRRDAAAA
jgi:hypothetical protein